MGTRQSRKIALAISVVFGLTGMASGGPEGAVDNSDRGSMSEQDVPHCDSVCELQAQDSAFALLIEAYRQFQTRQIQLDYERQLKAVSNLSREGDSLVIATKLNSTGTLRACTQALAQKERDLRLEQLQTRVANFSTAYQSIRKDDEQAVGQPVANTVDPSSTSRELKTLRVLALGSASTAGYQTVVSRPATDLFLDAVPAPSCQAEAIVPYNTLPVIAVSARPTH